MHETHWEKKKEQHKTLSHSKVSAEKQALHHNPASLMKYGEVRAPIDKSPDETLFLRKEAKLFRAISQLRRMQVSEKN